MKKIFKSILLTSLVGLLSGCDMFDTLKDLTYKSLDEFFEKNNYEEVKSSDEFNPIMQEHVYFWQKKTQTYTNTSNVDTKYFSPHSDYIHFHQGYDQVDVYTRYSERFTFFTNSESSYRVSFSNEDNEKIFYMSDETLKYVDSSNFLVDIDDEHKEILQVHKYETGYLFATNKNSMVYVDNEFKNFYLNCDDTNVFTNYEGSITLPDCDLLTSTLNKIPEYHKFNLPIPNGITDGIHYKDYVDDNTQEWIALDVIIPYVKCLDYVELIKSSGLEIYRGEYHELFDLDGAQGGEYVFYDQNHELQIHLEYQYPIAVVLNDSNYGIRMRIQKANETFSYFGSKVSENTDWSDADKKTMQNLYGYVLPYIKLGRHLSISQTKRNNGEHPMSSALDMNVECYWVQDSFYKDVITKSYGKLLEADGFKLYEPPINKDSTSDEISAWKNSEDVKYYECYLKDGLDIAIKIWFDDIYGNTIRVFKLEDLKPWHSALDN